MNTHLEVKLADNNLGDRIEQLKKLQVQVGEHAASQIARAVRELEGLDDLRSLRDKADSLRSASSFLRNLEGLPSQEQGEIEEFASNLSKAADSVDEAADSFKRL